MTSSATGPGLAALARFHLHVGAQLAMRAAAPLAGVPIVVLLLQQDPSAALRALAAWLLGPFSGPGAGLATAAVALTLATWAAPRVAAGLGGWARHLPASESTQRRAALCALVIAQVPLLTALLLLAPIAARPGVAPARIVGLPLLMAAAALAAWPGRPAWPSRGAALLALVLVAQPGPASLVSAALLLPVADRLAGTLRPNARTRRRPAFPAALTSAVIALRALGVATEASPLLALMPVGAMTLLRLNNDLSPSVASAAARLGGGLGVVILLAALSGRLASCRPVWPWARSLPVGSRRRVAEDAVVLAVPCLVPLAATAALDPPAALAVLACLPFLAFRAAGALRGAAPGRAETPAVFAAAGALLVAWVAVLPWLALAALAIAPLAFRSAAERDRLQKVGRWEALHHRSVGDPLSWSAR
ncbi:MAG TPA: hypothetical protein VMT70_03780 [Vicinamibacteria bacterium]|nr:hypothetical protein [Vicinamibacteria bacterium]